MVTKMGTGWVFASIYIRLLTIIFFAIGLYLIFQAIPKTKKLKFIWVFLIAAGPGFGISFIEPVYNVDYGLFTDDMAIENIEDLEAASDYEFNGEYNLLMFGTTNCPHCKASVRKLVLNTEAGQTMRVSTFFGGTEADALSYLSDNGAEAFDHHMIKPDTAFLNFSGYTFPSIFLIQPDGSTMHHWTGDMLNFSALDLIADLPE